MAYQIIEEQSLKLNYWFLCVLMIMSTSSLSCQLTQSEWWFLLQNIKT